MYGYSTKIVDYLDKAVEQGVAHLTNRQSEGRLSSQARSWKLI